MVTSGVCGVRTLGLVRLPFSPENPCLRSSPFFLTHSWRLFVSLCSASKTTTKSEKKEKVIVISGPTGAGKSRLALELAKRLNGEIISADSVQVYQGLDVGSAKPSTSDRKEVLHHLVDILHPSEGSYTESQMFQKPLLQLPLKYVQNLWIYRGMETGMQLCNWWSKQVIQRLNPWLLMIGTVYGAALRLSSQVDHLHLLFKYHMILSGKILSCQTTHMA